jgi:AcrR family transcriptional regulator
VAAANIAPLDAHLGRGNASGRLTRELIIVTAERLFAERGIHAVSLREIGQEAGQRNTAATQYHFGTRENLLAAIYVYRSIHLNERRWELFHELQEQGARSDVEALLRAILLPHVESIRDRDNHFLGYLARILTDEATFVLADLGANEKWDVEQHLDALRALEADLRAQLPGLDDDEFARRYSTVFNWAIHGLAEYERSTARPTVRAVETMFDELLLMLSSALRAVRPRSRARGRTSRISERKPGVP